MAAIRRLSFNVDATFLYEQGRNVCPPCLVAAQVTLHHLRQRPLVWQDFAPHGLQGIDDSPMSVPEIQRTRKVRMPDVALKAIVDLRLPHYCDEGEQDGDDGFLVHFTSKISCYR